MSASHVRSTEFGRKVVRIEGARDAQNYNGVAKIKRTTPRHDSPASGVSTSLTRRALPQTTGATSSVVCDPARSQICQPGFPAKIGICQPEQGDASRRHDEPLGWPLALIYYVAVWFATWALAHHLLPLAIAVGTSFVVVPGLYVLLRIRLERLLPLLYRGGW